ncbi:MAG: DUF456 domain-containing protein [wastewater metagenome]|nr:DUF456 domain-containing protein [Candidatus Loosdrechtia aerotolerans]
MNPIDEQSAAIIPIIDHIIIVSRKILNFINLILDMSAICIVSYYYFLSKQFLAIESVQGNIILFTISHQRRKIISGNIHMGIWEIILLVISLTVMFTGMVGIIVPIIPSIPLIWIGAFIYALFTHFEKITWMVLLLFALLTVFSLVLENLGNVYGAKRFGATKWGLVGSVIGTGVGFYLGGPIGLIAGPVVGTVVFEIIGGQGYKGALKSGFGNFVGFLGGSILKVVIGIALITIFIWKVFS